MKLKMAGSAVLCHMAAMPSRRKPSSYPQVQAVGVVDGCWRRTVAAICWAGMIAAGVDCAGVGPAGAALCTGVVCAAAQAVKPRMNVVASRLVSRMIRSPLISIPRAWDGSRSGAKAEVFLVRIQ